MQTATFVGSRVDGTVSVVDPVAGHLRRTIDLGDGARIQGVDADSTPSTPSTKQGAESPA
ncbi:hypothetical protein DU504_16375 [Haloplanus salinus]|uniref:Uncharacterized protein n=1 Tax=Haloplanus salinus TaxID=1126245 RepID=A0A368N2E3_9EURY|nr:hypothetical protein [Haloplanus salinus]RCU44340.1 hypothetical protein DU504_16375 [Haloplanus salinus]